MRLGLLIASALCSALAADEPTGSEPHDAPVPAGTVCQNITGNGTGRGWTEEPIRRLRGQHIVACGSAYQPFLSHSHDANGHAVWYGLDADLLAGVAQILDFNYTILPIAYIPGERWTDMCGRA